MDAEGTLATELGDVRYNVIQGDHVCLGSTDLPVEVNRVRVTFSFHLYLQDGEWLTKNHSDLYAICYDENTLKDVSPAGRRKIAAVVKAAWETLLQKDGAGHLLINAQLKYLTTEIDRKRLKARELEKEALSLRTEIDELYDEKAAMENRLTDVGIPGG